ncbi:MAG: chemotaxis protein CheW [Acidobacteriota bacterium]
MNATQAVEERVCFVQVGGRVVGLLGRECQGVVPYDLLTPVPHSPEWVAGLANFRGRVLPLLLLHEHLGEGPVESRGLAIIVTSGSLEAALDIEKVLGFELLDHAALAPPSTLEEGRQEFARARLESLAAGAETSRDRSAILLHVGRMLGALGVHRAEMSGGIATHG